jgi:hypothetical protein
MGRGVTVVFAAVALAGVVGCASLSSLLSTTWSENYARASEGGEGSHPYLNDGKLSTVAETPYLADPREFIVKFAGLRRVRRIRLTNDNLYRFSIAYWDTKREDWREVESIRQRRDVEGAERVIQPFFEFTGINFETDRIRIDVTRTVDDTIITKRAPEPNDKIIEHGYTDMGGRQVEYFRVLIESPARVQEFQVYGIGSSDS